MAEPDVKDRSDGDPMPLIPGGSSLPDLSYGKGGPLQSYAPSKPAGGPAPDIGGLLGPDGSLTQAQGAYTAKSDATYSQMDSLANAGLARVHRAYEATGIGPEEYPKWDEAKEREKFLRSPMEAFGSTASVFAIIASAFTRAPMENALNGAAAAMTAIRANDQDAFESAHRAWKENIDLAFKRHEMQREHYLDSIKLMDTDVGMGRLKLENYARQYGDKQTLLYMQAGLDDKVFKLMDDRQKAILTSRETAQKLDEMGVRKSIFDATLNNWQKENQGQEIPPQVQLTALSTAFGLNETAQQMAARNYFAVHPDAFTTPEKTKDATDFLKSLTGYGQAALLKAQDLDTIERGTRLNFQELQQQHPDWTPEKVEYEARRKAFQEHAQDTRGKLLTPDQQFMQDRVDKGEDVTQARAALEALKRVHAGNPQQQEVRLRADHYEKEILSNNPGMDPWEAHTQAFDRASKETKLAGAALLSDADASELADEYISGNRQAMTNLGRGAQGPENVLRVRTKIREKLEATQKSAKDVNASIAEFEGLKAGERATFQRLANLAIAQREAVRLAKPALDLSEKIDRTNLPALNKAILTAKFQTGNTDVVRFKAAVNSFLQAYVRAVSPTGVPTDFARKHAYDTIANYYTKGQFREGMDQLRIEMNAAASSPGDVINEFRRIYGAQAVPENLNDVWKGTADSKGPARAPKTVNGTTYYPLGDDRWTTDKPKE